MVYTVDFDANTFDWWSGARDTIKDIEAAGLMDELTTHIEEVFGFDDEPPSDTDINDYVWHDRDRVYDALGLDENGELPSDEDDEEDDEEEEEEEEEE